MLRSAVHWLASLMCSLCATAQVITTIAGTTFTFPSSPLPALNVPLGLLQGIAVDATTGNVYVGDLSNNVVIRFAPGGQMTVVAGNGIQGFSGDGGPATSASLNQPTGVAVDTAGTLYIADFNNNRIRKVSAAGTITTFAGNGVAAFSGDGGPATIASLSGPVGVAVDSPGNLYIVDKGNQMVREVSVGTITTIAGNGVATFSGDGGPATSASLNLPEAVAVDSTGSVYIADAGNARIRKVSGGTINTFAGNGTPGYSGDGGQAKNASLNGPQGVAVDSAFNVYIADVFNNRIRKVSGGIISTVAGNAARGFSGDGGPAQSASLNYPYGVAVDSADNLFVIDYFNHRIREVSSGTITTVAGAGNEGGDGVPATSALLNLPFAVAIDMPGNLYIADFGNNLIRKVSGGIITTFAGNGTAGFSGEGMLATSASLNGPEGVAVDPSGNVYIADFGNNRIRKVSGGIITTVAGNATAGYSGDGGLATSASLNGPSGVTIDPTGNLYIADEFNNVIRKVSGGIITTVAGNGTQGFSGDAGPAQGASLSNPYATAVDLAGTIYIADQGNSRIRKVSNGRITTFAGGGSVLGDGGAAMSAELKNPFGVAVDSAGNLYIADTDDQRVRKVTGTTINTVAGNGTQGFSGDGGLATNASLFYPEGLAMDSTGNLYIADSSNGLIREVLALPPTFTASPLALSFSAVSGGLAPPPQGVQIAASVPNLVFSAQVTGAPWLTLSANSGMLPYNLHVSVDPSQLAPGPYAATIVITAPLASTAPVSIQVSFTVTASATPKLTLSAQSLSFSLTQGASPVTSQLTLTNQGGSLNFTAVATPASGGNWISIAPASGTVTASSPVSLTVTASPGNLTAGTYTGTITVTSVTTGQVITVPATLTVNPPLQKIVLSQLGFTFVAVAQGGTVLPQSLSILNGGSGAMTWTAKLVTPSGSSCPWLSLSESSGTVTRPLLDVSQVQVSVNAQGLAMTPGSYYCLIQVSAANASNSPQSALVVLDLLKVGSNPGPDVEPSGLVFTAVAGAANQGSKTVQVANVTGVASINFSAVAGYNPDVTPWLQILPTDAVVTPQQSTQIVIQPNFGSLAPGVYHAGLELVFNDGEIRTVTILGVVAPAGTTPVIPASESPAGTAHTQPQATSCTSNTPPTLYPTFTQLGEGASVPAGWPSAIIAEVVDGLGNAINTGSVVASFDNGDAPLPLTNIQFGQWSASWTPGPSSRSSGVTVTLTAASSTLCGTAVETVGLGSGQSQPIIASPVSAVTLTAGPFAPGDLMLIQGSGLADAQAPSSATTLVVFSGGFPAQLLYVNPSELIALVPPGVAVNSTPQLVIQRDTSTVLVPVVNISTTHPAIFSADGMGQGQALVYNASPATLADVYNPAQAGGTVIIYCSGLGAMDPQGRATNTPTVTIGGLPAPVSYAGVAQVSSYPPAGAPSLLGLVSSSLGGLYQITATVPAGVNSSAAPLVISSVGQASQSGVTMAVGTAAQGSAPAISVVTTAFTPNSSGIAQNTWTIIQGANLVPATTPAGGVVWTNAPSFAQGQMPTTLNGISVTVNGKPAYIYAFCSAAPAGGECDKGVDQINVLTPLDATLGSVQVVVNNNGVFSQPFTATLHAMVPALFNFDGSHVVATHLNYTDVGPTALYPGYTTPASPAEQIVVYGSGFGIPAGATFVPGSASQSATYSPFPTCTVGGTPATVAFAEILSPGLLQLNVDIPSTAANGDNPISCTFNGLSTPVGNVVTVN